MSKNIKNYDVWVVDPHGRVPGESMGHLIGLEAAKFYASKGKRVLLVTSTFSHILKTQRYRQTEYLSNVDGIDIVMLKTNSYTRHVGLMRIVWHLYFCFSFLMNFKAWGRPEHISVSFPFPFFDLIVPMLKKTTGAKIVLHFSDLWPEVFELALPKPLRSLGKYIFYPFFLMRDKALLACDGITFVSQSYNNLISNIDKKIKDKKRTVIYRSLVSMEDFENTGPSDPDVFKHNPDQLIINYSGTLGSGYDIAGLVSVIERIKASEYSGKVKLYVSGKGPHEDFVRRKALDVGSDHMEYKGVLPYSQLLQLYKLTDLACLPYMPDSPIAFPAKAFDYIVAGTPIIHSIDGELRSLSQDKECGIYYKAGDHESLYLAIIGLLNNQSELLQKMTNNMAKISHEFTVENTLNQMYDFYQLVASESQSESCISSE
ncbi:glycosyltransferase family 4 protein [Amylibacter sp.]|nr:glycosyltransferase family 4 protein [Amylibacter sp.]